MTLSPNGQCRVQGWVVSSLVHGLALTVAFGLMAQVKPVAPKEVFKWDVALVEPQRIQDTRQAEIKPVREPAQPTQRPTPPASNRPQPVTQEVQIPEVTAVVQHEIHQALETSEPIQQPVAVQTITEPTEVSQTNESVIEPVASLEPHEAVTAEPAITPSPATVAVRDTTPIEAAPREVAPQVAMATRPTPAVKADYGWLAESLRRRLAELKRYPSTARLNGWEGKVVLRAVIRADGHLVEVKVHRSSGHDALDNAAMETIRLACPLHLTNAIGAAEVAMYVPIVYSLGG